ncbi:VIT family protein [Vulcanococcus limneticus Candia 3F8]|uniref:VIT1/CCC1 transporter family protein n=1 Tax=Vulcanococcus limneticus TaxID=2170428 RepID=UPI000B997035|nr:VIT family protein [Vulcanococcus limneticus]MCP9790959.1 VIT family protein [Vulcanococcus limneticus MW73D5]MCP9892183.1 VIT family protein [Vulcanococcus limneticus Candia 3F8]MCP9895995.1 VIT family protein [Vulcanococcus limneticus Candia 3B3]
MPVSSDLPDRRRRRRLAARHAERHNSHRVGWLRAAVLGANDGTISVSSLVVGIAASGASRDAVLISAIAATVAGALSMAAGEYVSVQSQADTEGADLAKERHELATDPAGELAELVEIYEARGLDHDLAVAVAEQLSQHDALAAHARDELGLTEILRARPVQAALASAASFAVGACVPLATLLVASPQHLARSTTVSALLALALFGALSARAGGASVLRASLRLLIWGAIAMGITAAVGRLFGAVV